MEAPSGELLLGEESKSVVSGEQLRQCGDGTQLRELAEELEDPNGHADIQLKYYLEFRKIYFTAFKLATQINKQARLKDSLAARVAHLEAQMMALHKAKRVEEPEEELEEDHDSKRKGSKRTRRTAQEIERKYYCTAEFCDRCYGSQGSLQQHIKLKHPELYKREGESEQP